MTDGRQKMTPLEKLEHLRTQAWDRGDAWEAFEMQQMIDDLRAAIRCEGCGAIIYLDVMPVGGSYTSVWLDYRGNMQHFNPKGGYPLMTNHMVAMPEGQS